MDNKISNLTEVFNTFFYKKFTFILDNKILREGRLKLFTQKGFNLKFFITEGGDDIKIFEIPYPFAIKHNSKGYIFDYRVKSFTLLDNPEQIYELSEDFSKSRLFDKQLILKIE